MSKLNSVRIDGRYGEGGGSILRLAVAMSAVTGKPVTVNDIRRNRPRPGLAPQHLNGLKAMASLFGARTKGMELGSTTIEFDPREPRHKGLSVDVGTAGSTGLILQILMIVLPFIDGGMEISLKGGTHVRWSPNIDYIDHVTIPLLEKMGYEASLSMRKPGYYPKGGGQVIFHSRPCAPLKAIDLESFGSIESMEGVSRASNLPSHVPRRQAESASSSLSISGEPQIDVVTEDAFCPGSAITLWGSTSTGCILGSSALGEKGKPAEKVGREAAEEMNDYIQNGSPVDHYALDQLLPYAALAKGRSVLRSSKLTKHAITNIYVVQEFLDLSFEVEGQEGRECMIAVKGAGLEGI